MARRKSKTKEVAPEKVPMSKRLPDPKATKPTRPPPAPKPAPKPAGPFSAGYEKLSRENKMLYCLERVVVLLSEKR
jgi:hypothetical protein